MISSVLKRKRLIAALNEEIRKSIHKFFPAEEQRTLLFPKKQVIFQEGDMYRGVFIISSGLIKMSSQASGNRNLIYSVAGKGDYLGYVCFLMRCPQYISSASALTDSKVTFIPSYLFRYLLDHNAQLKERFIELMGIDAQDANQKMFDLAYKPVRGRLADALLLLDDKMEGRRGERQINLTRNELASYIGSVRETTIRLLSELKQEKIINIANDLITVVDHEKLIMISGLYE